MQRLNLKLVIWLSASTLLAGIGIFLLHSYQMTRTAGSLLERGQARETDGELDDAIGFYMQYVEYRPDDAENYTHMALMMADLAENQEEAKKISRQDQGKRASNARNALERALRLQPERDDVRSRLVKYFIGSGKYGDASELIQHLLKSKPDDADLLSKLGICQIRLGRDREGVATLEKAIAKAPDQIDSSIELALALRERLNRREDADKVIDDMVAVNPDSAKAYLRRATYLSMYYPPAISAETAASPQTIQRKADIAKALELAPDDADAILLALDAAAEDSNMDRFKELLACGAELHPDDARMTQKQVQLALYSNDLTLASDIINKGPKNIDLQRINFRIAIQQDKLATAREILDDVKKDKSAPRFAIDHMEAILAYKEGKWLEASKEFERLRSVMPGSLLEVDMMLGHCYEMLGEADRQVEAFQRAVDGQPNDPKAHAGLGRAWTAVGQNEKALAELQLVKRGLTVDNFVKVPAWRNTLITLLVDRNTKLPEGERDWADVDELLEASKKATPDSQELVLLDADVQTRKGEHAKSREMLDQALEKDRKNPAIWLSLAKLTYTESGAKAAIKLMDEAQAAIGDDFSLRTMRLACALELPKAEAEAELAGLAKGLDHFKPDQQDRLRRSLGYGYYRLGNMQRSGEIFKEISATKKQDPQVAFVLFDIAVRDKDEAAMKSAIDALKGLFGAESAEVKYTQARRLIALLRANRVSDPKAALKEAQQLVKRAEELRPRWSVLPRIAAEIDIFEDRIDDAIVSLYRAIDYGDTDPLIARQLTELLLMRGRGDEAKQTLQMANSRSPAPQATDAVDTIQVSLALADNNVSKAIELLELAREKDPDDMKKALWLGQILAKAARFDEAEALFRMVVDKQPDLYLAWRDLVQLLKDQRRENDAREVIALAEQKSAKDAVDLLVAQCYELLGDLETAERYFQKAREAHPNDLGLSRAMASYYARTKQPEKTKKELERLSSMSPQNEADREQVAWANRELATIIASSGSYTDFRLARERLSKGKGDRGMELMDKVALAQLLANRPEADSRLEAIKLLEQVKAEIPLRPEGQLILARLYEETGSWDKCRGEMLSLLSRVKDNVVYLGAFVEMLVRHNEADAAKPWVDQMEIVDPKGPLTTAVKARLLVKQDKPDEAVALLRGLIPRPMPRERIGTLPDVANLLEELGQFDAAESMYREYHALDRKQVLVLAGFVGRHGSLKDALDLCEEGLEANPTEMVIRQGLHALRDQQATATKEDYRRVESWITKYLAKNPKSLIVHLEYTELLDLQNRYKELEDAYVRLLKNPEVVGVQRALVLNNLAFLLAAQDKTGDSRKYIDEAISILAPQSDLLDTRALVHLAHGEVKEAVSDLSQALIDQPSGMKYFHLAMAQQMAKNSPAATEAMKKALETYKLTLKDVVPLEQPKFKKLMNDLGLEAAEAGKTAQSK